MVMGNIGHAHFTQSGLIHGPSYALDNFVQLLICRVDCFQDFKRIKVAMEGFDYAYFSMPKES